MTWLSELEDTDVGWLRVEDEALVVSTDVESDTVVDTVVDTLVSVVNTVVVAVSVTLVALSVGEVGMSLDVPGDREVVSCRLSQPMEKVPVRQCCKTLVHLGSRTFGKSSMLVHLRHQTGPSQQLIWSPDSENLPKQLLRTSPVLAIQL